MSVRILLASRVGARQTARGGLAVGHRTFVVTGTISRDQDSASGDRDPLQIGPRACPLRNGSANVHQTVLINFSSSLCVVAYVCSLARPLPRHKAQSERTNLCLILRSYEIAARRRRERERQTEASGRADFFRLDPTRPTHTQASDDGRRRPSAGSPPPHARGRRGFGSDEAPDRAQRIDTQSRLRPHIGLIGLSIHIFSSLTDNKYSRFSGKAAF